jgi:oxygen-dependent protoporphyrinogen oxidase
MSQSVDITNPSGLQSRKSVVIIGAGISGLCVAYWLKKNGVSVTVLESSDSPGGTMKTDREGDWLIETGPNSALETTPLFKQMFEDLGILKLQQYPDERASKRFIVKNKTLHALPMGPGSFVGSQLWSTGGKLRLLKEPFIGRATKEETIAEFVSRRLGREFLEYAINPFVAGVYAGDPAKLSVQSAFPKLYALEEKYGSLIKGALRSRSERKKRKEVAKDRARLFSFKDGMQTFPNAIASFLGNSVKYQAAVNHVIPMRSGKYPVYTIAYQQGEIQHTIESNSVVYSAPAHATAKIIHRIDPAMSETLESIYYPPVAEVFMGFSKKDIGRDLDGFGFLVPEVERRNILGTIWTSSLFPNRSPEHAVALTSFIGGARQPQLTDQDDNSLQQIVFDELKELLPVTGPPILTKILRWQKAIPQYNLGYYRILRAIDSFEENFAGSFICSNFKGGIAVGDCVMNAEKTAKRVCDHIAQI